MRFARLMAVAVAVMSVAASGLFLFAPTLAGQESSRGGTKSNRIVSPRGAELEVLTLGGSRLGVEVRDVDQADVSREKLAGASGAVVEEVRSDSPAAKAGLKSGDVIVSFDGERVRSARQLDRLVEETPAGRTVKLSVQRGGSKVDLDVTPETSDTAVRLHGPFEGHAFSMEVPHPKTWSRLERDLERRFPATEFDFEDLPGLGILARGRLGVQVQDLSPQLAEYFGVKSGVLVAEVSDGSRAAKAGIKVGDVITAINGRQVDDFGDLRREVARADEDKPAELSITRDRKTLTLKVDPQPPATTPQRLRRTV